jgi:hypothetical protein
MTDVRLKRLMLDTPCEQCQVTPVIEIRQVGRRGMTRWVGRCAEHTGPTPSELRTAREALRRF